LVVDHAQNVELVVVHWGVIEGLYAVGTFRALLATGTHLDLVFDLQESLWRMLLAGFAARW
jgi:hypothetical protein